MGGKKLQIRNPQNTPDPRQKFKPGSQFVSFWCGMTVQNKIIQTRNHLIKPKIIYGRPFQGLYTVNCVKCQDENRKTKQDKMNLNIRLIPLHERQNYSYKAYIRLKIKKLQCS